MIIGITGGIGAGKSTVMEQLMLLGFTCLDADIILLNIYSNPDHPIFKNLLELGGSKILSDGKIDWNKLREVKLGGAREQLLLDAIWDEVIHKQSLNPTGPLIFCSARIIESKFPVDKLCVIACPENTQRNRALARGVPPNTLDKIMSNQIPLVDRLKVADYIIDNHSTVGNLLQEIEKFKLYIIQ